MVDFTMEDVGLCDKAREHGYRILVDARLRVRHEKPSLLLFGAGQQNKIN